MMSTKIRQRDAKNTYMQNRDPETQHKGFRDFEIQRKFAETQDFQKTICHPLFCKQEMWIQPGVEIVKNV